MSCIEGHEIATQKRILNAVRVKSSLYTMNLASLNVRGGSNNSNVNWNQGSDRAFPSLNKTKVITRGNSTKRSITRLRPGSLSAGGTGIDIKHNSYDRYLLRKKSKNIITQLNNSIPIKGNKTRAYGIVSNSVHCNC